MKIKNLKKKSTKPAGYLVVHNAYRRLALGERMEEIYESLKKETKGLPFLMPFTFGEYGYADDQTNTTGDLMLSFTSFEE